VNAVKVVALAGGVGGAKLAHGLYHVLAPNALTVVVNTGDDFELYGLRIMPDADTVLYTLAGLANPDTGWGVAGDSFETLAMLGRYGAETWFQLGDRDFATHIARSERLRAGWTPTQVLAHFTAALGMHARLLPMCDEPVATVIQTAAGELAFQDYFVRRHHADTIAGIRLAGIEAARVPEGVRAALEEADVIVFCPSNPIVSIGPILAIPGMRVLLQQAHAPKIAISPIVGGKALRGPADAMLQALGYEASPLAVARLYDAVLTGMVIDTVDAMHGERVAALPLAVTVADTVMRDEADREQLARQVLDFAERLTRQAGREGYDV
jgi:LPPG:FO 2-phospho-L-lactate transferase